jgi:hypothetical protein
MRIYGEEVLCMLFEVMKGYPPLVEVLSPVDKRELIYEMLINRYIYALCVRDEQ